MGEYFTRTPEHGVTQLYHKSDRENPVSTIHYAWEKNGLFAPKNKLFRVTNQPNASKKPFGSLDAAVAHSMAAHRQQGDPAAHHPVVKVAHHINKLGDAIDEASSDSRMDEHHQTKLVDVAKAYASLVDVFNKHFGK